MTIEQDMIKVMKEEFPQLSFKEGTVVRQFIHAMAVSMEKEYDIIKQIISEYKDEQGI